LFNAGPIFLFLINCLAKLIILQGGTSSGKTYATIQWLIYKAIEKVRIITITSESIPNLKKGAYRDFESIIGSSDKVREYILDWNKSERIVKFKNGSVIEFISNVDEQSAKAGKRDILFLNEVNAIPYQIFWQLAIRTREQIVCDYNPNAPFYLHDKFIGTTPAGNDLNATVELCISDHRHNPFLSDEQHRQIEGIKDKELWWVYARGKTGNLTGLIFPNFKMIPDNEFPFAEPARFGGIDYGYTNDPTAALDIRRVKNKIFVHELSYEPDLTPKQIKQLYKDRKYTSETPIYSEHDHTIVNSLRLLNMNIIPALKPAGSVFAGIMMLRKDFEVYYTESSKHIDFEKKRYMFVKNPDTGLYTNEPMDLHNHCMDALRYGVYTRYFRKTG
jgi:phage terminase large subunit